MVNFKLEFYICGTNDENQRKWHFLDVDHHQMMQYLFESRLQAPRF